MFWAFQLILISGALQSKWVAGLSVLALFAKSKKELKQPLLSLMHFYAIIHWRNKILKSTTKPINNFFRVIVWALNPNFINHF